MKPSMLPLALAPLLALAGLGHSSAVGADSHPFSIHDMLAMDRIGDANVSPNGNRIVFVRRTTDLEEDRGRTDLWLVNLDGSGLRRLTSHPAGDFNPRWAPDGRSLWFISTRSGSAQVWRIPGDGGEAVKFSHEPLDISALIVSPTGSHIAVAMDVYPNASPQETKSRLDEIASRKSTGRIYDKLLIRHWDTWKDGRRSHLFVIDVAGDGENAPVDIMKGMEADCPSKPFGGPEEITFAPNGKSLVFAARDAGREEAWSTDFDLYSALIDGSATPRCLTNANNAWDTGPVFSPDGRTLAYLAMERPGYESDRFRIMLMDWPSGPVRTLTDAWDRSVGSMTFSSDGSEIYATAGNLGQRSMFGVNVKTGKVRTIVKNGNIGSVQPARNRVLFARDNLKSPVELFSIKTDGSGIQPITQLNRDKVAATRMGEYEQFTFAGWNGEKVHAYVLQPADFDPAKKYPVAFLIHGGPQGSFGNHFHYRWNPQAYAGAGYACVMVDFHGSTGYGQDFCDSIRGDWGGKPLVDLKKGLAAALARYSWMDGDRVSALGASYGGFMINWIAGNWPDRFRCLINHDGNLDERLAYYDTEELWFPEWDRKGTPWNNPKAYEESNPVHFVKNWKTPMLVIHGALDYRVVDTQGMSTFTALQRRGIPSKFLYFPDENHWVLQPANGILWHDTVIGWLDQWTK